MSEAQPSPPWGALPAEQYLIRNWDSSSPLPGRVQTRALIRAFLALDNIPEEWDATDRGRRGTAAQQRVPTAEEVRTILEPWRPRRWRDAALKLWTRRDDEAVWLRTYYGGGRWSDDKFRTWRDLDEDYDPCFEEDNVSWTVLDDADVFGDELGDEEWWRVFDVLPELAGPLQGYSRRPAYGCEDKVQALREELYKDVQRGASASGEGPEEAAILEAEYGVHGQELQVQAVSSFLLVADARAWETDCLRLLYLDAKGNIVRHSTIDVSEAWETRGSWMGAKFCDCMWWGFKYDPTSGECCEPGAELGDKYRARGEMGRSLYGLQL